MKQIPLTNGGFAMVDDSDFEELSKYRWYGMTIGPTKKRYAARYEYRKETRGKAVHMHRQLLQPAKGLVVDHIDGDGLNNQRHNIRVCTRSQNGMNRNRPNKNSTTGVLGVSRDRTGFYTAILRGRVIGRFEKIEDAISMRLQAASEIYGEFAPSLDSLQDKTEQAA